MKKSRVCLLALGSDDASIDLSLLFPTNNNNIVECYSIQAGPRHDPRKTFKLLSDVRSLSCLSIHLVF